MNLEHVMSQIEAEPRSLYWRVRLVRALAIADRQPKARMPADFRHFVMESLLMVRRADSEAAISARAIDDWSVPEARRWVRLIRKPNLIDGRLARVRELFEMAYKQRRRVALLREARRALSRIPKRHWRKQPWTVARLLFDCDLVTFTTEVPQLVEWFGEPPGLNSMSLVAWLVSPKLDGATRGVLRRYFETLGPTVRDPYTRLRLLEFDGLQALRRRDLATVEATLNAMTQLVPEAHYAGNLSALVDLLVKKHLLGAACLRYVDAVLVKEWRRWVRPRFEVLRAQLVNGRRRSNESRSSSRGTRARGPR